MLRGAASPRWGTRHSGAASRESPGSSRQARVLVRSPHSRMPYRQPLLLLPVDELDRRGLPWLLPLTASNHLHAHKSGTVKDASAARWLHVREGERAASQAPYGSTGAISHQKHFLREPRAPPSEASEAPSRTRRATGRCSVQGGAVVNQDARRFPPIVCGGAMKRSVALVVGKIHRGACPQQERQRLVSAIACRHVDVCVSAVHPLINFCAHES
eukprot:scaffold18427_cov61-Phaeocystis_antarctica.AAC.7